MKDLFGEQRDNPDDLWLPDSLGEMAVHVPAFRHRGTPTSNNVYIVYLSGGCIWLTIALSDKRTTPRTLLSAVRVSARNSKTGTVLGLFGGGMTPLVVSVTYGLEHQRRSIIRDVFIRAFSKPQKAPGLELFAAAELRVDGECWGSLQSIVEGAGECFLGRRVA